MPQLLKEAAALYDYVMGIEKIDEPVGSFLDRLIIEEAELSKKTKALTRFLNTPVFGSLPKAESTDLEYQHTLMVKYLETLKRRIIRAQAGEVK